MNNIHVKLLSFNVFRSVARQHGINLTSKFDCVLDVISNGFVLHICHFKIPVTKECFRLIVKYFGKNMQLSVLSFILDYE